jgi:hypothetical protein
MEIDCASSMEAAACAANGEKNWAVRGLVKGGHHVQNDAVRICFGRTVGLPGFEACPNCSNPNTHAPAVRFQARDIGRQPCQRL